VDEALRVREFWFGRAWTGALPSPIDREGLPRSKSLAQRASVWFETDPRLLEQHDELIRAQFSGVVERAARGELSGWADSPRRRLSLIILLDQLPRHIHRGTAQAFAWDEPALSLALSGMQSAADAALNVVERIFFYMPLQHAESQEVQDESVAAYRRLLAEAPADLATIFEEALGSAQSHREIVNRFGRFPHRNRILGRAGTAAEDTWLRTNTERFGQ